MAVDNWSKAGLTTLAARCLPCTGGAALRFHKHGCMLGSLDDCSRTSMPVYPSSSCSAVCFSLLGAGNCHYSSLSGWDVSWTSEQDHLLSNVHKLAQQALLESVCSNLSFSVGPQLRHHRQLPRVGRRPCKALVLQGNHSKAQRCHQEAALRCPAD
jgi:hypothetical protein